MPVSKEETGGSPETTIPPEPGGLNSAQLLGKMVRLSSGQTGEVVHVEYERPGRVALVKTFPENPCPLTRVAVDRFSPDHLPSIMEILGNAD